MINGAENLFERLREKNIRLTAQKEEEIRQVDKKYPLRISDYYFDLIDWEDENCPIYRQAVPAAEELNQCSNYSDDPLSEGDFQAAPYLVHKYQGRAAFMSSNFCYMHCRHCTRKNTVMSSQIATREVLPAALDYVRAHPEINDILITGGEPLALPLELLEDYIAGFRSIPTVNTIRIGTRALAADPERVTDTLADMLKKYRPLWVFTQFNHPKEVTPEAMEACERLMIRGIPLGNQSVLMKGINDDEDTLAELYTKLIGCGVRPYYLYICDRVNGTAHFYVDHKRGMALAEKLRYRLPGYAVPRLIIDTGGEYGGKVTIEENHILEETPEYLLLRGSKENTVTKYYL